LKPENILLNGEGSLDIRIADFGFASVLDPLDHSSDRFVICGTPGYIPPEVLQKQGYNLKSDVFSAGAVFFALMTRKNLFYNEDKEVLLKLNKECNVSIDRELVGYSF
jgi:serine/threonine protein kinase